MARGMGVAESATPPAACRIREDPRRPITVTGASRVGRKSAAAMQVVKRKGAAHETRHCG
jgi:hypothetical protein